jgi:hypothetical protein
MFTMMLLAHMLGDYVLQFNALARWKARSIWGVVAHGLLVTGVTVACAVTVVPGWWPYALLIGLLHTLIDLVRSQLIEATDPTLELLWYLADQVLHVVTISATVWASGVDVPASLLRGPAAALAFLILLQPAWVMLRFIVRGIWGATAAPPLGAGEKVLPMLERVVVAVLAFVGVGYLAPLVLLPRRLGRLHVHGDALTIQLMHTTHWAETFMGTVLALVVGWIVRLWLPIL